MSKQKGRDTFTLVSTLTFHQAWIETNLKLLKALIAKCAIKREEKVTLSCSERPSLKDFAPVSPDVLKMQVCARRKQSTI